MLVTALGSWEKTVPRGHLIMPYTTVRAILGSDGVRIYTTAQYTTNSCSMDAVQQHSAQQIDKVKWTSGADK